MNLVKLIQLLHVNLYKGCDDETEDLGPVGSKKSRKENKGKHVYMKCGMCYGMSLHVWWNACVQVDSGWSLIML